MLKELMSNDISYIIISQFINHLTKEDKRKDVEKKNHLLIPVWSFLQWFIPVVSVQMLWSRADVFLVHKHFTVKLGYKVARLKLSTQVVWSFNLLRRQILYVLITISVKAL